MLGAPSHPERLTTSRGIRHCGRGSCPVLKSSIVAVARAVARCSIIEVPPADQIGGIGEAGRSKKDGGWEEKFFHWY